MATVKGLYDLIKKEEAEGKEELIVWGQDRIWLIEERIKMMQTYVN